MENHTKGPWQMSRSRTNPYAVYVSDPATERSSICTVTRYESEDETMANVRLIAAAPELLDAAIYILAHIEVRLRHRQDLITEDERGVLRRAIAKASGES